MAKTVVGLFDNASDAENAVQQLTNAGIDRSDVSLLANNADNRYAVNEAGAPDRDRGDREAQGAAVGAGTGAIVGGIAGLLVGLGVFAIPGIGPVLAAGWIGTTLAGAGIGAIAGGLIGALVRMGIPEEHAHLYAEGVRRGGTLVLVRADDATAENAADILRRNGAVDIDRRAEDYQTTGFTRFDEAAQPYTADQVTQERGRYAGSAPSGNETRIPVVEEQVNVDKRPVTAGGARVYTHVTEEPVRQDVNLREENVTVDRRPVDRPLQPGEADAAFREGEINVTETREEPVVSKSARVVEEVVINKDVNERTATVDDTVRRTNVDVQELNEGADLAEDRDLGSATHDATTGRGAGNY
jgi:stress response protein YsnF